MLVFRLFFISRALFTHSNRLIPSNCSNLFRSSFTIFANAAALLSKLTPSAKIAAAQVLPDGKWIDTPNAHGNNSADQRDPRCVSHVSIELPGWAMSADGPPGSRVISWPMKGSNSQVRRFGQI